MHTNYMHAAIVITIAVVLSAIVMFTYNYFTSVMEAPAVELPPEVPIGTIVPFAGNNIPAGWIACDNASYPPTTYPKLYDAIGYTYGMDGKNYRVPDTRGVFMRGIDPAAVRDTNRPAGSIQLSVSMDYMPTGMIMMWYPPLATITSLALAATYVPEGWAICDGTKGTPDLRGRFVLMAADTPAPVAGATVHPVRQTGGEETHVLSIAEMPSHNHGYNLPPYGGNSGGIRIVNYSSGGYTDNPPQTGNTGGNQPHNTLPPFYSLIYIMRV
jgi:microcystin-dependent protein